MDNPYRCRLCGATRWELDEDRECWVCLKCGAETAYHGGPPEVMEWGEDEYPPDEWNDSVTQEESGSWWVRSSGEWRQVDPVTRRAA